MVPTQTIMALDLRAKYSYRMTCRFLCPFTSGFVPSGRSWCTAVLSRPYVECVLFGEFICKLGRRFLRGRHRRRYEVSHPQFLGGSHA